MRPALQKSPTPVCEPCKKRKKRCNKGQPSCSRCSRLSAKCYYPDPENTTTSILPPLKHIVPTYLCRPVPPASISPTSWIPDHPQDLTLTIDDRISSQTSKLLSSISRKRGPIDEFVEIYFETFHRSLPIIDPENFRWKRVFQGRRGGVKRSCFESLVLCVFLVTELRLGAERGGEGEGAKEELYRTLKSFYALLQATGEVSVELVQMGALLASWEHCQAMPREAWLTIGGCARMGHVLGLHLCLRGEANGVGERGQRDWEERRCLWWGIVVLERVFNSEFEEYKLPLASEAPRLDDILPSGPLEERYRIAEDLVTAEMVDQKSQAELFDRKPTKLGFFPSTIQATYLASLVMEHVRSVGRDLEIRRQDATKIDTTLKSFGSTMIPPPGKAKGAFCGAYWMCTNAAYKLHYHELKEEINSGTPEGVLRAKLSLQSLTRVLIVMTKYAAIGIPLDLDQISFWSHSNIYLAAMVHVRFGDRDSAWEDDLEVLKSYIRGLIPMFKLHAKYLKEIEAEERACSQSSTASNTSMDTFEG